jgi:chorismate dehydratase
MSGERLRVGVVCFTNTLPLATGLERHLPDAELVRITPAEIADRLESGSLDVGLVPVASVAAHPSWSVVPGLGIAAEGPVRSVLLLSRVPLEEIRVLVADPASRTSNALARLWLRHRLGREVEIAAGAPALTERLAHNDATVAIGDDALFWEGEVRERIDLGGAWTEWTGLPFVFAVWAGPGAGAPGLSRAFHGCYEANASRPMDLARAAAPDDPARAAVIEDYLRRSIRYRLGDREREGLLRYIQLGREAGYFTPRPRGTIHADNP